MDLKNVGGAGLLTGAAIGSVQGAAAAREDAKINALKGAKDINEAAVQFEAMLVNQMMNSMWETVPEGGLLSGSREEGIYRDMFTQAISEQIARGAGIGIKQVVTNDIKRLDKIKGQGS